MHEDYFSYANGKLYWVLRNEESFKTKRGYSVHKNKYAGKEAGNIGRNGYRYVRVYGKLLLAHRIIWEMFNGPIPEGMEVDHIDTNPSNNDISNLRLATSSNNKWNMNRPSHNTSGFKGVSLFKATGKYEAYIKFNGRKIHIGFFDTPELAHEAYKLAADKMFMEFSNHGN